ncbi:lipoyl synthase [Venenivibrio stagnispumantis]|uniref:Lipoyl synthase n=1 Tax=Venenivibrio stagnispumantis TaxID=407998 RepID=A0AA46AFR9_9AQUI|nr:lipoyl synthase [Venenivibrio stagnispumantis]MCW4574006.1 lipoyl synthase [Venenivibrio stagnispumantis]SMP21164.1 lipoic acid synthetase [Venenivibrio stagnispumantis]
MKPKVLSPLMPEVFKIKKLLRHLNLNTVCEEASCPNIGECFSKKTATFMIMGDICTRNCPYCNVSHGKPMPLDEKEPENIAKAVNILGLKYVVITSVDRDDLKDGGASHFAKVIQKTKEYNQDVKIEVLIPDFKGSIEALKIVIDAKPDVINHNIETVLSLYKKVRPQGNYQRSLELLKNIKDINDTIITKSGLMVGLGEEKEEIIQVMQDLRNVNCDILTIGQYLQPSKNHLPVSRYLSDEEFEEFRYIGEKLGFKEIYSGKLVRSSYHAGEIYKKIV